MPWLGRILVVVLASVAAIPTGTYRILTFDHLAVAEINGHLVPTPLNTTARNELFSYTNFSGVFYSASAVQCVGAFLHPMVLQGGAAYNVHMKLRLGLWRCPGSSINLPWRYDEASMQIAHRYYRGWCWDASTSPIAVYLCDPSSESQRFRLVPPTDASPTPRPPRRRLLFEPRDAIGHRRWLESDNPEGFVLEDETLKLQPMRLTMPDRGVIRQVNDRVYLEATPRNGSDEWFEYNANHQTLRSMGRNDSCLAITPNNQLVLTPCCAPVGCYQQNFVVYKNRIRHPSSFCVALNPIKPATNPLLGQWCNDLRDHVQFFAVYKEPAPDHRRLDSAETRITARNGHVVSEWGTGLYVNGAVNNKNEWFTYNEGGHTFQVQSNRQCIDAFWSSDPSVKWWVLKLHTFDCGYGNRNQEWAPTHNRVKHLNHAGICLEARGDKTLGVNTCKEERDSEWLQLWH